MSRFHHRRTFPPPGYLLLAVVLVLSAGAPARATGLDGLLRQLDTRDFREKTAVAERIAESGHPRAARILSALIEGNLYVHAPDGNVVMRGSRDASVRDAATGEPVPVAGRLNRIVVNILMRRQFGDVVARLNLRSPDTAERLSAARELAGGIGPDRLEGIRALMAGEENAEVRAALAVAVTIAELEHGDEAAQVEALANLSGNLQREVRSLLRRVADDEEAPPQVRIRAAETLSGIETRVSFYRLLEQVFFGLSLGSVLLLAAIGLAITFGVMGVINMAHGELIMIGAYTTYVVQQLMPDHIGISLLVAVPAAFLVAGAFGVAIERGCIRFLYGRPLETLLATFGISLILQQLVRTIFSPLNRSVITPGWMSGSIQINPVLSLTLNRLCIIVFALLVFTALVVVLKRSTLGLKVRAVSQNRAMARAVGVRSEWVDAMTFGLGAGIAGVGGVALSQLTNVGPNLGQSYIIDSFLVVVFGGVGNLLGTLTGAMTLGVANKFLEPVSGAVLAKILVLVFIILFIQRRPRGLFPQRGRAAEG